jgi:hypothetical protein
MLLEADPSRTERTPLVRRRLRTLAQATDLQNLVAIPGITDPGLEIGEYERSPMQSRQIIHPQGAACHWFDIGPLLLG